MEQQILNLDQRVLDLENWADRVRNVRISQAPRTQPDGNSGGTLTGANNGLSLAGTIVQLGGPLLQDTTIDGASTHSLALPNMVNFTGDVTTSFDISRDAFSGTYSIFNEAASPVGNAAGVVWTDADETLANFITRQTGESTNSYTNTTAGITSKVSVNPSDARISYENSVSFDQMLVKVGPSAINLSALQTTNSTEIELTPFQILIDSKSKPFKLNEGTTATGTNTAEDGMVLTLIDKTTGVAQYRTPTLSTFEAVQGVGNPNVIVFQSGLAGQQTIPFADIVQTTADITLNAGGDVTINTAGKYKFTLDTIWQASSAAASRFVVNAQVNTVDDIQTYSGFSVSGGGGGALRATSHTFVLDLVATDNVEMVAARFGGSSTITSLAGCRLTVNRIG